MLICAASVWQKQAGAVLLAMMLVILAGASFVLISKLNSTTQYNREYSNIDVLKDAKAALIGYAVTYPESFPGEGPGFLPCPDKNNDGISDPPCALAGPTNFTVGRLPYKILEVDRLVDHSGEALWYAVADNYRNNPKVASLNSDTEGNFSVDSSNDVVAIIFAPGPPIAAQDRASFAEKNDVSNYLEDDNANNDADFVSRSADTQDNDYRYKFNDRLVTITRQELMREVEKRVLGDIAQSMSTYQGNHGAFPWLTPFSNPATSVYRGQAAAIQGHIPFHWSADPDSVNVGTGANIAGRNPFSTSVAVRWDDISGATISLPVSPFSVFGFANIISAACLNDINDCDEGGLYPEITTLSPASNINCTWVDRDTADCATVVATASRTMANGVCPLGSITRQYIINFPGFVGTTTVVNPTAADTRRRSVSLTAANPVFLPPQNSAIVIRELFTGQVDLTFWGFGCMPVVNLFFATGSSSFDANTVEGTIAMNGIQYDLDIDNNELPSWFVRNGWQNLVYTSYASGEPLPGNTTAGQDCVTLGTTCLTLDTNGKLNTNVRAIVVSAGVNLPSANPRPSGLLTDYYEGENASPGDDAFSKNKITTANNDQTRIIATAP